MTSREKHLSRGYAAVYSQFDSPLIQKVRSEAFEEDIGQHSWLVANELREYLNWLSASSITLANRDTNSLTVTL